MVSGHVVASARRWFDACWPAALFVLFLATFRNTGGEAAREPAVSCDETHATDAASLERCLDLDPRNVELMTDAADRHLAAGAADRAEALYRRALAIDADDGDVHLRLGELLLARGDAAGARREAAAALRSQPGSAAAQRLAERAERTQ